MSPCISLSRSGVRLVLIAILAQAVQEVPARAQREAETLSASFRGAAERVLPSVVAVRPLGIVEPRLPYPPMRGPRLFPGQILPAEPPLRRFPIDLGSSSTGTGLVFSTKRGLILTTEQAISGAPRASVIFTDGREVEAHRVVRDPRSELVLLSIDSQTVRLKEADWGSSAGLHVGDWVLSLGRPSGRTHAVSAGIVSGRGAGPAFDFDDAIRTDAVIDAANSGGPLVDLDGKVVGINRGAGDSNRRQTGFGFAIPAERARQVASDLADFGYVRHGYLGVVVGPELGDSNDPSAAHPGLVVTGVSPGGPAAEAGIRVNDRILGMDGRPLSGLEELSRAVEAAPIGQEFRLDLDRSGKRLEIVVKSRPRQEPPRPFPGGGGGVPGALAPRAPAGSRTDRTSPKGSPPAGGPVLRSESQEDRTATKPAPSLDRNPAEFEPAPKADPELVPR